MASKDAVKVQVIPVSEGRWAVPSTTQRGVTYEVVAQDGQLVCNCIAGLNNKFCKHKQAVSAVVEADGLQKERELAGEPGPVPPVKKNGEKSKFTKHGYVFGEVTSALQKSIRRSDEREAVYWAMELYEASPHYLAKRLVVIASEDVGMAAPDVVVAVNTLIIGWAEAKKFSWFLSPHPLTQAVVMLARAPKSTEIEDLQAVTYLDLEERNRKIPADAIDMHTAKGKELAKQQGKDYDAQCIDWYQSRLNAGIEPNKYVEELWQRKPQWAPKNPTG